MPARMLALLEQRFERVTVLSPVDTVSTRRRLVLRGATLALPFTRSTRTLARRTALRAMAAAIDLKAGATERRVLDIAMRRSHSVQRQIDADRFDALFGCCISSSIYGLETDVPIVYFSDATPRMLNTSYPELMRQRAGYKSACETLERVVLSKCAAAAYASTQAHDSAVNDYGAAPERVRVIPMGAHITPDVDLPPHREPPSLRRLQLCIAAADPVRKRLDLAIEATELLAARGWHATLTSIGRPTPRARRSPVVECAGVLRLADAADRLAHQRILARSHFMLLPSIGEAFGIAPCEAAHFGCPSIVSSAGGLPTVVQHNRTGLVLPLSSTAADYADAIESLARDPARYLAMCAAAYERARAVLSWDRWGDRIAQLITNVVEATRTTPPEGRSSVADAPLTVEIPLGHLPTSRSETKWAQQGSNL